MILNERQSDILKSIVDIYIDTAEPVGSKAVADNNFNKVSSATIRNEMSFLEEHGYLSKPHRSAGRVPTDQGYREYVDNLMTLNPLSTASKEHITEELRQNLDSYGDLLKSASSTLSKETGFVSVTFSPEANDNYVRQLKILSLNNGRALVVVALETGITNDRLIKISKVFTADDLDYIAREVENNVNDIEISKLKLLHLKSIDFKRAFQRELLDQVLYEIFISIKEAGDAEVYVDGWQYLLEFAGIENTYKIYETLNDKDIFLKKLNQENNSGRTEQAKQKQRRFKVCIGKELLVKDFANFSLIATSYELGDDLHGELSLLGPKRMDYENIIPMLSFISDSIKQFYYLGEQNLLEF